MHYKGYAFALNRNRPTITNKDGSPVQPNENYFTQVFLLSCISMFKSINIKYFFFVFVDGYSGIKSFVSLRKCESGNNDTKTCTIQWRTRLERTDQWSNDRLVSE